MNRHERRRAAKQQDKHDDDMVEVAFHVSQEEAMAIDALQGEIVETIGRYNLSTLKIGLVLTTVMHSCYLTERESLIEEGTPAADFSEFGFNEFAKSLVTIEEAHRRFHNQ